VVLVVLAFQPFFYMIDTPSTCILEKNATLHTLHKSPLPSSTDPWIKALTLPCPCQCRKGARQLHRPAKIYQHVLAPRPDVISVVDEHRFAATTTLQSTRVPKQCHKKYPI
jgi:hypothetical protein